MLLSLLALALGAPQGASARLGDATRAVAATAHAADEVHLVVARLTGVIGPGSVPSGIEPPTQILVRSLVEYTGTTPLDDVEVVVETFARLTSRNGLRQALDAGEVGTARVVRRLPVREGTIQPGDIAAVDHFLDVSLVTQSDRTGVYPIKVTLTRGTDTLDSVVTAVVHLGETPINPLATVMVWPVDAAPVSGPGIDGISAGNAELHPQLLPGGRIDDLVAGLEAAASSGIVPNVSASLLDALARRAVLAEDETLPAAEDAAPDELTRAVARASRSLLQRLRRVLGSLAHAPVAGAFADADLAALLAGSPNLGLLAGELAAEGPLRVEGLVGRTPDPATHVGTTPLTPATLDLLPGDHLLLPWSAVEGPDLDRGPDLPSPIRRLRATSGRLLTATVADPWLSMAMATPSTEHGHVVAVQRILAGTAMVQFLSPGLADRPLLLLPPRDWDPGGRVARSLAPALVNAPWLRLQSGGSHAAAASGFLAEAVLASGEHLPADLVSDLGATRIDLAGIRSSLPDGVATVGGRLASELEDQLRRATSHWFTNDPDTSRAMIADVRDAVEDAYGVIEVPTADSITLVSAQGRIPITIRRPVGDILEVEVEVRSRGALSWPNGAVQLRTIGPGETRTLSFDVLARSRGDFPLEIIVRDASGSRVLADATVRVRSTFTSRPALIITASVVVLLLVVGRLRRGRREGDDPEPGTGEPGTDGGPPARGLTVLAGSNDDQPGDVQ